MLIHQVQSYTSQKHQICYKKNRYRLVISSITEPLCAIWYHLYNLINVKNTNGGVLLLVKLQVSSCNFTKSNTLPLMFFTFFKLQKWYQIAQHMFVKFVNVTVDLKASASLKSMRGHHQKLLEVFLISFWECVIKRYTIPFTISFINPKYQQQIFL